MNNAKETKAARARPSFQSDPRNQGIDPIGEKFPQFPGVRIPDRSEGGDIVLVVRELDELSVLRSRAIAVPRELFWKILSLIDDLRRRPVPA